MSVGLLDGWSVCPKKAGKLHFRRSYHASTFVKSVNMFSIDLLSLFWLTLRKIRSPNRSVWMKETDIMHLKFYIIADHPANRPIDQPTDGYEVQFIGNLRFQ